MWGILFGIVEVEGCNHTECPPECAAPEHAGHVRGCRACHSTATKHTSFTTYCCYHCYHSNHGQSASCTETTGRAGFIFIDILKVLSWKQVDVATILWHC